MAVVRIDPCFTVVIVLPSSSSSAPCTVLWSLDAQIVIPISPIPFRVPEGGCAKRIVVAAENTSGGDYLAEGQTRLVTKSDFYAVAHGFGTSDVAVNRNRPPIPYAE